MLLPNIWPRALATIIALVPGNLGRSFLAAMNACSFGLAATLVSVCRPSRLSQCADDLSDWMNDKSGKA